MIGLMAGHSPCVWQGVYWALGSLPVPPQVQIAMLLAAVLATTGQRFSWLGQLAMGVLLGGVLVHLQTNQWLGESLVALGGWLITL